MTLSDPESPFYVKLCILAVCRELCRVAFGAWLMAKYLTLVVMLANFKPKQTAAASCGFLAIAQRSCLNLIKIISSCYCIVSSKNVTLQI